MHFEPSAQLKCPVLAGNFKLLNYKSKGLLTVIIPTITIVDSLLSDSLHCHLFTSLDDYSGVAHFYEVHKYIVAASLDDASNPNMQKRGKAGVL